MSKPIPKAPASLSTDAAAIWKRLAQRFMFSIGQLELLEQALLSLDRAESCRRKIAVEGMSHLDRHGVPHPHSLLRVERDSRAAFVATFKKLDLHLPESEK
jgi:hypothetical protein